MIILSIYYGIFAYHNKVRLYIVRWYEIMVHVRWERCTGHGRKCTPAWSIRQERSILEPTGESRWFESGIAKTPSSRTFGFVQALLFELPLFFSGHPSLYWLLS